MENAAEFQNQKTSKFFINALSVAVPAAVVALLALPNKFDLGAWTKTLPHVIGVINSLTSAALIVGFFFIKQNNILRHRQMMTASFALGGVFLICYVLYHISNPANRFAGAGAVRYFYLFVLFSHIALSFVVLPLVLRAMFYAFKRQFARHKKIARFAYPIWLYVSITGVIVYLMNYQIFTGR